jgi:hypothetical protein
MKALQTFLTRENNGIDVYELKNFMDKDGREIHVMSNGASYHKDDDGKWQMTMS